MRARMFAVAACPIGRPPPAAALGKHLSRPDERLYYLTGENMNVTAMIDGKPGSNSLGQAGERHYHDPHGQATYLHGATGRGDAQRTRLAAPRVTDEYKTADRIKNDYWLYLVYKRGARPDFHPIRNRARLGCKPTVKVEQYACHPRSLLAADEASRSGENAHG